MLKRVIVIGGGVIGITTALALARRGADVTVLESAPAVGSGASAGNGAQLSYSYADALGAPAILSELPRLLAGRDPAFRIHLSAGSLRWALSFLMNCTAARFAANTRAVLLLALQSRAALAALRASCPDLEFSHTRTGKLFIYDSAEKLRLATATMGPKNELGCSQRAVGVEELFAIEPALARSGRDIEGAIFSPFDETGDAQAFTRSLAAHAARDYGVKVLTRTPVQALRVERQRVRAAVTGSGELEADVFVLAAGAASRALARGVGLHLPIHPMKGYSITLPATASSPTTSITDSRARIVFARLGDQVRVAGMAELGRADTAIDSRRIAMLLEAAKECLPAGAEWRAGPNAWSGLRPMTPDCRPIISRTAVGNLLVNCGHGMLGWTLACASADLLASLVSEAPPTPEVERRLADFSLRRFD